jgi:hypothetical protein
MAIMIVPPQANLNNAPQLLRIRRGIPNTGINQPESVLGNK